MGNIYCNTEGYWNETKAGRQALFCRNMVSRVPEIQILTNSKFSLEEGIFLGCLLINPSFDDQRLVSIVVVVVVKEGRHVCLKVLIKQLVKCQSPSGKCQSPSENRLRTDLLLGCLVGTLSTQCGISHLGFYEQLPCILSSTFISYYSLSLLSTLGIIISSN